MNLYTNFLLRLMFFVKIKNILLDCNKFAKTCAGFSFLNMFQIPPPRISKYKLKFMKKNIVPENFPVSLAVLDIIPVVLFSFSSFFVAFKIQSTLFSFGAFLCFMAGILKILWKFVVALAEKNVWSLYTQFRFFIPLGFTFMIASIFLFKNQIDWNIISNLIFSLPQIILFSLGFVGVIFLMIFTLILDDKEVKSNWILEITNLISQIFIFLGIIFSIF